MRVTESQRCFAPEPAAAGLRGGELLGPLFAAMAEAVVIQGPDGRIADYNPAAERIFGLALARLAGEAPIDPGWETIYEDGAPVATEALPAMLTLRRGEPQRNAVIGVRRPDGKVAWLLVNSEPIRNAEGRLRAVVATYSDISRRKESEASLKLAEERWQAAMDSAGHGVWDWNAQTGEVFYSRQWKTMLGYAEDEINGSFAEWDERIHPDDRARVYAELQRHVDGQAERFVTEHRVRRQDGGWQWIRSQGRVISRTADGQPLRIVGTHTDVSAQREAEAAAAELSTRLRRITERAPGMLYEFSLRGDGHACLPFASAAITRLFGLSASAVREDAAPIFARLHPDDLPRVMASITASARQMTPWREEFRVRPGDGSERWLAGDSTPERGGDGEIRWHGYLSDVTDRRTAELALRESEARFRMLADSAPVLIWVSDRDKARHYFNRTWLEFSGRTLAAEAGFGWAEGVHADDRQAVQAICAQAYGEALPFAVEYRLRRHDGQYRWLLESGAPRVDAAGTLLGYVGSCIDIEDRRQAELSIRKLSRAVEQSGTAVVITDRDGRIEYVNPACCRTYGYVAHELIGENPRLFKSGQTPAGVYAALWGTILAGETWRGELCNRARSGALIWEAVSISPIKDESGRTTHFIALKEDITEQRRAEAARRALDAQLARLERMDVLGTLAGGIAHDFNNILVAILGFSELGETALRKSGGSPRVIGYLEEIRTAGERARGLVQQLLTFGRAGPASLAEVDVGAVIGEVGKLVSVTFPQQVALAIEVAPGLPALAIDPTQLHQVLMNLCLNARDAVAAPGRVVVSAARAQFEAARRCASCHREFAGDFIRLAVRDSGHGIDPELLGRVFEPFFTTKDVGKGTGMGLPVVHGIAHLYEGHIELSSRPGEGAEVAIYLPLGWTRPGRAP